MTLARKTIQHSLMPFACPIFFFSNLPPKIIYPLWLAVVVAQLVEGSLPTPEVLSSNSINNIIEQFYQLWHRNNENKGTR